MLELIIVTGFVGYLVYLRYYADQRTEAQKETERLQDGIQLLDNEQLGPALAYFNEVLRVKPSSAVAYLYRAQIYAALGDPTAALADLSQGKSYDDTIAELHIASGRIQYAEQNYLAAFQDFDKAIFYTHGQIAEPFRWRGVARQHLDQLIEAEQDLKTATLLDAQPTLRSAPVSVKKKPFFDRQFWLHTGLIGMNSVILLYIVRQSPFIHFPYFWAAATAVGLGFLEPRRGWALALLQAVLLLIGYYTVLLPSVVNIRQDVEAFGVFGSIGLTFVGSLIGSVLQKSLRTSPKRRS